MTLFRVKPWQFKGRRMERNAPRGYRCDGTCTHPQLNIGTKTSLCTVCHETFSTSSNFDVHRKDGWCVNPATVGLRLNKHGHWGFTMDEGELNRLRSFS